MMVFYYPDKPNLTLSSALLTPSVSRTYPNIATEKYACLTGRRESKRKAETSILGLDRTAKLQYGCSLPY